MRNGQRVVIVGGGFSGVALAVALLRSGRRDLHVTLVEATERVGRGLAYGTSFATHLLNTRVLQMSLHGDDPEHFLRWSRARGLAVHGDDFLARRDYGAYLEESFAAACREGSRTALEVRLQTPVQDVVADGANGFAVVLQGGSRLKADVVVLATGHGPPAAPLRGFGLGDDARYVDNPWAAGALARIGAHDRVLVLGTGLTAVDVALGLDEQGHRGALRLMSRHGVLPQPHARLREVLPRDLRARLLAELARNDLRAMVRVLRAASKAVEARGQSWHAVLDALRPLTARVWAHLCTKDRQRFLRWLRPQWDAHRHRVPPAAAERFAELRAAGRLAVAAGRVCRVTTEAAALVVDYVPRGAQRAVRERYDWVVNCTGSSFARDDSRPLEGRLLESGLLLVDPLGLGYVTSDNGVAIGRRGPVAGLYVLGPACRPNWWEHTAVPELRAQAAALASELVATHAPRWLGARNAAVAHADAGSAARVARWSTQR